MQTVIDTTDLRSMLGELEQLRTDIASVKSSEAALIKRQAEGLLGVRREMSRREEADGERLNHRVQEIHAAYQADLTKAEIAVKRRLERMHRAYHSSKLSLAQRTQEVKDRRIGQVQGTIMQNRHERHEELEWAKQTNENFQALLQGDRSKRRELRASVLKTFRSFKPLVKEMIEGKRREALEIDRSGTVESTRDALLVQLNELESAAQAAPELPLVMYFRHARLWVLGGIMIAIFLWIAHQHGDGGRAHYLPHLLIAEVVLVSVWGIALMLALPMIHRVGKAMVTARTLENLAEEKATERLAALALEIKSEQEAESRSLSDTFSQSASDSKLRLSKGQQQLDERFAGIPKQLEKLYQRKLGKLAAIHDQALKVAHEGAQERAQELDIKKKESIANVEGITDAAVCELLTPWKTSVLPAIEKLRKIDQNSREKFPNWTPELCENWVAPEQSPETVRIGSVCVDAAKLAGGLPNKADFSLENGGEIQVPLSLNFPAQGSLIIESDGQSGGAATLALNAISMRLFASAPAGRFSFVFIDPVGLGKDFAGLMHLADYEESLIHSRIWTQTTQIEERLAELNEHIEKVIQMYLRNEYATIAEYNEQAGTIAEKYRFLVIAGFPAAFSDTAMKRLLSIATSGARCGVYLLIHRDTRLALAEAALDDELRRACIRVILKNGKFHLSDAPVGADLIEFDPAPQPEDAITLIHRIGRSSIDSNRVQVPFSHITPSVENEWKSETNEELRVPIGRTGAKKLQMLAIGKGTRQHVLVAGKTGSGKSTLFHVIITNLALYCSPDEVEFYLVDFKKGVEFKCYASKHLPHARVIAIESDREFALSVLQRVDAELKRRGELFRKAGSQDLAGYKKTSNHEPLPRSLLLIDEFQEFFTEDDTVAQEASLLLDRIVRQGRAFGIHVILGSQTLGGAYTLARATLGQMVIRIALQCNEADAHLIMDDDNPAPRLLTRPGEGIYNDQAGTLAANSPFQIVWLPEEERDAVLDHVSELAAKCEKLPPPPIIFEGNAPADIRDNAELWKLLGDRQKIRPERVRAWLGAPNSIKGPTEALFQRQSGSHLLVVGQSVERSTALLAISVISLAAQYPVGGVDFVVLDPHAHETDNAGIFQKLAFILPQRIRVGGPDTMAALMGELAEDLKARAPSMGRDAPEVFLIVQDLQRFKALRPDDEFRFSMDDESTAAATPAQVFSNLLDEGGPVGMHVIVATDTWNNVSRWIPRKLMAEFEMRVLFQMSANDSSNLIDSPAATTLGLHRALFYNEHFSTLETFRPYAMPDDEWFDEIAGLTRNASLQ